MNNENSQTADASNEKEIEIKLEEDINKEDNKDSVQTDTITTQSFKTIESKNVNELTDDERAIIIANAKNGVNQLYYDVKFFRNGKHRIVRKKQPTPTVSSKVINTQSLPQTDKKAYYTDNQLLFEHIIELNNKVEKLMNKHKKLKRKYQSLQNDIYIDDEDVETVKHTPTNEPPNEPVNEPTNEPINETNNEPINQTVIIQQSSNTRSNWRSRLRYL